VYRHIKEVCRYDNKEKTANSSENKSANDKSNNSTNENKKNTSDKNTNSKETLNNDKNKSENSKSESKNTISYSSYLKDLETEKYTLKDDESHVDIENEKASYYTWLRDRNRL